MKIKSDQQIFPKSIGEFTYVSDLGDVVSTSKYDFAHYKDSLGRECIAKAWVGSKNDQHYRWIINEIKSYRFLNETYHEHQSGFDQRFPSISIPQLLHVQETPGSVIMIMEKAQGKLLSLQTAKVIRPAYESLISYFGFISEVGDLKQITLNTRSYIHYFLLFHLYLLLAIKNYPDTIQVVLKSLLTFYRGSWALKNDQQLIMVHRDLGGRGNVFIQNGRLSVIDFEMLTLTHKIVQVTNIVLTRWSDQSYIKEFFASEYFNSIKNDPKKLKPFKGMLVYGAVLDLATKTGRSKAESVQTIAVAKSL